MNSINPLSSVQSTAPVVRGPGASGVEATAATPDPIPAAQTLQVTQEPQEATGKQSERSREELQRELDDTLRNVQTSLRFRVDDDVDRVVVSVVDRDSGDLIYQIPSEAALQIAKRMAELGSGMINESA